MQTDYTLVVFSHVRWHPEYPRYQHLFPRLAADHPVLFIEEPMFSSTGDFWECSHPAPSVQVCRAHTTGSGSGFEAAQSQGLTRLISELIASEGGGNVVAWLCTPTALELARTLGPQLLVYDRSEDFSADSISPEFAQRDAEATAVADVIFTDQASLFEAKRRQARNVYCLPSSVDAAHFHAALTPGLVAEPVDQAWLPHPRLGYFGSIDDRLDLTLIDRVAATHPEWSLVLVGPVAGIDPADVPRRPNILYTGRRTYDEFPAYLAGWDVCLLPFITGAGARLGRPALTLEYMVAERPIVSTALAEVAAPYGDVVYVAESPGDFVRACEAALASGPAERDRRAGLMQHVMSRNSWEATARTMATLITGAMSGRAG